jgi:molybdate transport system substrate-binding protein
MMRWALLAVLCAGGVAVAAADLSVMSAGALEAAVAPLVDEFQRASGHTVAVEYGTSPQLAARLARNQAADLLVAPDTLITQAIADRQVVASTRVRVGRIGVGVVVRRGAAAPDVSSVDALKRALLQANSIVYTQGSSGQYIEALFTKLGVREQLTSHLIVVADAEAALARIAAGGDRDLGFGAVTALKANDGKGTQYVAPLPDAVQNFTAYDAAMRMGANDPGVAKTFLAFLQSPTARQALADAGVQ